MAVVNPNRAVQIANALEIISLVTAGAGLEFVYDERDGNISIYAEDCERLDEVMANVYTTFEGDM